MLPLIRFAGSRVSPAPLAPPSDPLLPWPKDAGATLPPPRRFSPAGEPLLRQRLLSDLRALARPRHARWDPVGLMSVRSFLRERFAALGPLEEQTFGSGCDAGTNLILRLPGRRPELAPLLVAAHYDGPLHSIGADDNASGLAALLELARHWAAEPPRRPVWIVAFDQEEWGCLGSKALEAPGPAAGLDGEPGDAGLHG
jgi:acetylornithine deacetylase/succinyl-diaminopimelate desuccinylase-like protein